MTAIKYLCDYIDNQSYPKSVKESLKCHWKTSVKKRLEDYEGKYFLETRLIMSDCEVNIFWSDKYRSIYKENNDLWISSIAPAWRNGWGEYIKNDITKNLVDKYFHFLTQYWHRCNVTPIILFLMWNYNIDANWIGSCNARFSNYHDSTFENNFNNKKLTHFMHQVNCEYPILHNACYHYIRMWRLLQNDFIEDVFVNIDAIASLVRMRCREINNSSDLSTLGFNQKQIEMIAYLHDLRSELAAHPSQTKWWDFYELFENELDNYVDLSFNMILKIGASFSSENPVERSYEGITNAPTKFHDCFWFNKIPIRK